MGNVQTTPIPRVIPSVESYFQETAQIKYIQSLGNTRFMKVAKVEHEDGTMVAKVFVFPDLFVLDKFASRIKRIRHKVSNSQYSNCLGFSQVYKFDKYAILVRPFYKDTLHDRLSIRPFLIDVEKRWIAFQLLKALEQCARENVCHGDIKSHNILISSSNWVNLTDFASFKPTFIPCDTPSAFTFFFNASRQSGCNVAPERFRKIGDYELFNTEVPENLPALTNDRTEAMDIFSAGCVLVELLTDGKKHAFNFGQLIDYRTMDEDSAAEYVESVVADVPVEFRELISIMLDVNPITRKQRYAAFAPFQNAKIFPPIFEYFLYHYMGEFRSKTTNVRGTEQIVPRMPDDVITKLYVERERFMKELQKDEHNSVILLISLITSNIRACRTMNAKMDATCLLKELSAITTEAIVCERVVPYLVKMLSDSFVQVQTETIHVLTEIVDRFEKIPVEESRLFVDFVFPKMRDLLNESLSLTPVLAIASNLGTLALTALKFLEEGMKHVSDEGGVIGPNAETDPISPNSPVISEPPATKLPKLERKALHTTISEFFTQLITKDNNAVRQTVMEADNLDKLCHFFDLLRMRNDILMHMVTVHNEKSDWRLITSFFKNCHIVARKNPKTRNSDFFYVLLQQGLQSSEEFVVLESLRCIYALCNENRLEKATVWELCKDFIPFVVHPNVWIRIAAVDILKVVNDMFPFADIYCRIIPLVKPFLTESLLSFSDKAAIHECLVEPIDRESWQLVCDFPYPKELMRELQSRHTLNNLGGGRHSLFSSSPGNSLGNTMSESLKAVESLLRKLDLRNEDGKSSLEEKIFAFASILSKKAVFKRPGSHKTAHSKSNVLTVDEKVLRVFDLERGTHIGEFKGHGLWRSGPVDVATEAATEIAENDILSVVDHAAKHTFSEPVHALTCRFNLEELLRHKQNRYLQQKRVNSIQNRIAAGAALFNGNAQSDTANLGPPEIRVVAHLHEHGDKVTKLATHVDQKIFASSSRDRTVRLWTLNQIHNKQPSAITSTATVPHPHAVNSIKFMTDDCNHLVAGSEGGEISIYDVNHGKFLNKTVTVDPEVDGGFTRISCVDHLIYGLTAQSSVYCYDKRMPASTSSTLRFDTVFHRQARMVYGYITSMSVDPVNQHWMALTTSTAAQSNIVLFDLRFLALEVAAWGHPSTKSLVLNSWPLLTASNECTRLATGLSKEGEVSIWRLDNGCDRDRSHVLWPGDSEPAQLARDESLLQYNVSSVPSSPPWCLESKIRSLQKELQTTSLAQSLAHDGFFTGDSAGSLRFWSLSQPSRCNYLSGPYRQYLVPPLVSRQATTNTVTPSPCGIVYRQYDDVDGSTVIRENRSHMVPPRDPYALSEKNYQRYMPVGERHRDGITDLGLLGNDYLASGGRDGVVKVWRIFSNCAGM